MHAAAVRSGGPLRRACCCERGTARPTARDLTRDGSISIFGTGTSRAWLRGHSQTCNTSPSTSTTIRGSGVSRASTAQLPSLRCRAAQPIAAPGHSSCSRATRARRLATASATSPRGASTAPTAPIAPTCLGTRRAAWTTAPVCRAPPGSTPPVSVAPASRAACLLLLLRTRRAPAKAAALRTRHPSDRRQDVFAWRCPHGLPQSSGR